MMTTEQAKKILEATKQMEEETEQNREDGVNTQVIERLLKDIRENTEKL